MMIRGVFSYGFSMIEIPREFELGEKKNLSYSSGYTLWDQSCRDFIGLGLAL